MNPAVTLAFALLLIILTATAGFIANQIMPVQCSTAGVSEEWSRLCQ